MELETGSKEHRLLEQEGDVNPLLEDSLPSNPDFYNANYSVQVNEECRLCDIPFDSDEKMYFNGTDYYIACTSGGPGNPEKGWEDGRKGHKVRNMAVWNNHGVLPSINHLENRDANYLKELRDLSAEHIQEGEMIVYGSMQSFNDHVHFIASDLENEGKSDLSHINSYGLYSVDNGVPKLQTMQSREKIGGYMEQALTPRRQA